MVLQPFRMPKALDKVTKHAMGLPPSDRLVLAGLLLESTDAKSDLDAETAWNAEIRDRIRAIDEGRITGIAHPDARSEAERRLDP